MIRRILAATKIVNSRFVISEGDVRRVNGDSNRSAGLVQSIHQGCLIATFNCDVVNNFSHIHVRVELATGSVATLILVVHGWIDANVFDKIVADYWITAIAPEIPIDVITTAINQVLC